MQKNVEGSVPEENATMKDWAVCERQTLFHSIGGIWELEVPRLLRMSTSWHCAEVEIEM